MKIKKGLAVGLVILVFFLIITGTIFVMINQNTVEASNELMKNKKEKWSNIGIENIKFDTSLEAISTEEPENEGATEEELQKEKVTKISNQALYYIVVDYSSNVVTIYKKDEEGGYTIPIKAMVC